MAGDSHFATKPPTAGLEPPPLTGIDPPAPSRSILVGTAAGEPKRSYARVRETARGVSSWPRMSHLSPVRHHFLRAGCPVASLYPPTRQSDLAGMAQERGFLRSLLARSPSSRMRVSVVVHRTVRGNHTNARRKNSLRGSSPNFGDQWNSAVPARSRPRWTLLCCKATCGAHGRGLQRTRSSLRSFAAD